MESLTTELFSILKYLLPGFLTAWIYYAFTATPKPSQFERIIQALIFTIFIQGMVFCLRPLLLEAGKIKSFGHWNESTKLIWSYISSVALGFLFSIFANNDKLHALLRLFRITKQTSYHCEWYGAFHDREGCRVVLNLTDGRRIFGYPIEWPSEPSKGHFVLTEAAWIEEKNGVSEYVDMPQVDAMLFKVSDIQWVEFLKKD